jgi:hypothetical protein
MSENMKQALVALAVMVVVLLVVFGFLVVVDRVGAVGSRVNRSTVNEAHAAPLHKIVPAPSIGTALTVIKPTAPASARPTHTAASRSLNRHGLDWDALAMCESSGRWHVNTGNGFYGGLQFDYSTWLSNGGGKYAPRADLASKAEQIEIATRLYLRRGRSPWPMCGTYLY